MDSDKYIKLFANCIVVEGAKRSTICDLQKNNYELIPNSMVTVIDELKSKSVNQFLSTQSNDNKIIIEEYIDFLLTNEYAFYCDGDELNLFPEINNEWDYAGEISNAIIDIDHNSKHNYDILFRQLEELGCQYILLRAFASKDSSYWDRVLTIIKKSSISSIEIITPYTSEFNNDVLNSLLNQHKRVRSIILTNSKTQDSLILKNCLIEFTTKKVNSNLCCGSITPKNFRVNVDAFFESKNYNSCLNRKISIDTNGDIKNCPSMNKTFGNIIDTKLSDIIPNTDFNSLWKITKNKINTCKDCEFRHICSDCRAFLPNNKKYDKPKKCNYDPYTATWK